MVFDLDDTLVDTTACLIVPLERRAAATMARLAGGSVDEEALLEELLRLRRTAPAELESELRRRVPVLDPAALRARREILEEASPDPITMEPPVRRMLGRLADRFELYLLTAGDPAFQRRKLEILGLDGPFRETQIADSRRPAGKGEWLSDLLDRRPVRPGEVLVVGNRIDREIRAGNELGMVTVRVRHGEGSELVPRTRDEKPDRVVETVLEVEELPSGLGARAS